MKGDGDRAGSAGGNTKAESGPPAGFPPWAGRRMAKRAWPHQSPASAANAPGVIPLPPFAATPAPLTRRPAPAPAEVVLDRHRQAARQDRPGQEDRTGAHQPRVAFFQPLALERVQQVDVERRSGPEPVRAP